MQKRRPRQMRPYAAADGTPAADTNEVNATAEGNMVQVMMADTPQTTRTAFRGCPSTTLDTQPEKGKTPSRATANTNRDAANTAIAVLNQRATIQMMFMKMCPPSPRITAYNGTNGCGPPKEKNVSASGCGNIRIVKQY